MSTMKVPERVLPSFFKNIEIVGNETLQSCRLSVDDELKKKKIDCEISARSTPMLMVTKKVKGIYLSNNFTQIKELEKKAQADLKPIYDNISQHKENAWTRVRSGDEEFYMSWSSGGSMWVRTVSNAPFQNGTSYVAKVQVGTYSASGGVLGIQNYEFTTPYMIGSVIVSFILACSLASIVATGLGFVVSAFALAAANAAAALGFESFSCTVAVASLTTVAACLVFAVVFIGLVYLWSWLNRKYTIRLQIFNWDEDNDWSVCGSYHDNAIIAGSGETYVPQFSLPKKIKPGTPVTPPGFQPVEVLDSVCYYATVIWENDNTFMEGCSMALKIRKGNTDQGFMWAFDCPRFSDNQQAAADGSMDPKAYFKQVKWSKTPLNFSIKATSTQIPVAFGLDALSGASDNLYNVNIHIGNKKE